MIASADAAPYGVDLLLRDQMIANRSRNSHLLATRNQNQSYGMYILTCSPMIRFLYYMYSTWSIMSACFPTRLTKLSLP